MIYLKASNRQTALSCLVLAWLLWVGVLGYGQLTLTEIALDGQIVEPSGGDSQVVFNFRLSDTDPLSNDPSAVIVQCILIQNLGTATTTDIPFVLLQGPGVQTPSTVATVIPSGAAPPANCPPGSGAGGNVAFEAFIEKTKLDLMGFGGDPNDIPDDGILALQVAAKVSTSSLLLGSQDHTLKLRMVIQYQESVGSPPALTTFTDSITDAHQDRVSNSGINELNVVSFLNNTIRIGQTGLVGRFEVCDQDANSRNLSVDTVLVVQGTLGDVLNSDVLDLIVEAVGFPGSSSIAPSADFNRGGPGVSIPIGFTINDDSCQVFDVTATVSSAAQRGRKIHLHVTLFTSEGTIIDASAAPSVQIPQSVLIGSGILTIPDTQIAGSIVPIVLSDFPLPGLGRLDVQTQPMQFDPSVISVDSMDAQPPYQLESFSADNRAGLLRFTLKVDPTQTDSAKTQGTIALIHVSRRGQAGESTLFLFRVDRVLDADNADVTPGIVVVSGFVTLLSPGDVDFDGAPTVRDALIVANAILPCTTNANATIPDLTDEQKKSADVAPLQAAADQIPTCVELNSGDVREIARLAITIGISSGPGFVAEPARQALQPGKPWWQRWFEQVFHPHQDEPAQATLVTTGAAGWQLQLDSHRPVAAIQGRIRFDPRLGEVERVEGLDGYQILAHEVNSRTGVVRFAALAVGAPRQRAAILQIQWRGKPGAMPELEIEHLLDQRAASLPVVVSQAPLGRPARLRVAGLRLHAWDVTQGRLDVLGQAVAHTTIEGFDLAGQRRFAAESAGNMLRWTMLDVRGRPLANGIYLYVVTVRGFSGEVWRSEVRKLVWLR